MERSCIWDDCGRVKIDGRTGGRLECSEAWAVWEMEGLGSLVGE